MENLRYFVENKTMKNCLMAFFNPTFEYFRVIYLK